jgi:heterodisulfide reductase subunit B
MDISYYPGCTLKTKGLNFEKTALALLELFDVNAVELEDWYCCGVMYSQTTDDLMHQLAPIRTLIKAKESGNEKLLTLCSMCYNTLRRAQRFIQSDEEKREKINSFMDQEIDFFGDEVAVVHLLEILQDDIGISELRAKIKKNYSDVLIAPYYGCMLTKPKEVAIVDPDKAEDPMIMEEILEGIGFETVYFPFKTECCASYQVLGNRDIVKDRTKKIVTTAIKNEADVIVLSCPLCHYNLDAVQKQLKEEDSNFETIPVLYISQLLALAYGIDPELNDFALHHIDPRPILERKGLL